MQLRKKHISFDETVELLSKIAQQYRNAKLDAIVSVGRGGLVPARLLSEMLDVKQICMLDVSSYDGCTSGELKCDNSIEAKQHYMKLLKGKNVLIVDDCLTTGVSLSFAKRYVQDCKPTSIYTAVMFMNKHSSFSSVAYAKKYNGENTWLVFPWEEITTKKGKND